MGRFHQVWSGDSPPAPICSGMGMELEALIPRVQHAEETCLGSEMAQLPAASWHMAAVCAAIAMTAEHSRAAAQDRSRTSRCCLLAQWCTL